jgi:hypothetical protein
VYGHRLAYVRQAPPTESAHHVLPPVLIRKAGGYELLSIRASEGSAHARHCASDGHCFCWLLFRTTAGDHQDRAPRQGHGEGSSPKPIRAAGSLHRGQDAISLSCTASVSVGGRLLPHDLSLDLTSVPPILCRMRQRHTASSICLSSSPSGAIRTANPETLSRRNRLAGRPHDRQRYGYDYVHC